jgi:hypothetical protein
MVCGHVRRVCPDWNVSQADAAAIGAAVLCFAVCSPGDLADTAADAGAVTIGSLTVDSNKLLTDTNYIVAVTGATLGATGAGKAKMVKCENNAWTKGLGATSADECRE